MRVLAKIVNTLLVFVMFGTVSVGADSGCKTPENAKKALSTLGRGIEMSLARLTDLDETKFPMLKDIKGERCGDYFVTGKQGSVPVLVFSVEVKDEDRTTFSGTLPVLRTPAFCLVVVVVNDDKTSPVYAVRLAGPRPVFVEISLNSADLSRHPCLKSQVVQ